MRIGSLSVLYKKNEPFFMLLIFVNIISHNVYYVKLPPFRFGNY